MNIIKNDEAQSMQNITMKEKICQNPKVAVPVIALLITLIVIASVIGVKTHNKRVEEERQRDNIKKYEKTLSQYRKTALKYGLLCEDSSHLILDVWYNTIFQKSDKKTDKYTKVNGSFNDDFNDSLKSLFYSNYHIKMIAKIELEKEDLDKLYKKAKKYYAEIKDKERFEESYSALKKLHEQAERFLSIASDANGAYNDYRNAYTKTDNEFSTQYKLFKNQIKD